MSRKKLVIILECVGLVTAVILVWIIGFGQDSGKSTGDSSTATTSAAPSPDEVTKKEVADVATKLAVDLTSGDPARFKAAYSHSDPPPMPPAGTTIVVNVDSAYAFEVFGRVDATMTWPDKGVMYTIIVLEKTDNGWLVHHMEKVA